MRTEKEYQSLIDQAFVGELAPNRWKELREHLLGCEDCRGRYDRATRMDRLLNGGEKAIFTPSPKELARVEATVFSALEKERSVSLRQRIVGFFAQPAPLAFAALAVLALIALPKVLEAPRSAEIEGEIQARSGGTAERGAKIRAFCVDGDQVSLLDRDKNQACSQTSQLKLAIGNLGGFRYAFVLGVQADGSPRWYTPKPPETESVLAPLAAEGEVPVGSATRLEVNHVVGPLRIYAIFSDAKVSKAEVSAAVAKLSKQKASIAADETLPLGRSDVSLRSLLIQVTP